MKSVRVLIVMALVMLLAVCVSAGASDKIVQLKNRVEGQNAQAVQGKPCRKVTFPTPVKEVGVKDQLPGDKEANEILIARADGSIKQNKAKIIVEKVILDSHAAVAQATETQDNFHQFQAKVLRESLIPK